ncbi:uncharacterized protein LOC110812498 [Carica papaya]|uniref:uncharacterized protein LOC110812498 n=1 Tax=Carica papaya TaxID=3649 RepID=UPI000B8CE7AD|nr:uncharacterized protein LOC110812498 [Carica papaya]
MAREQSDDSPNPFFLHSVDHSGLVLVSNVLNGNNYNTWERVIKIALNAKNKLGFIDGTYDQPSNTDSTAGAWSRCNSMSNAPRIYQLKQSMNNLVQGSLSINAYYTRMKIIWDDLKTYKPAPTCHCGNTKAWNDYQEQEFVMIFLMGLNPSYAAIRAQILMMESLPSILKVFSLVVQEERHRAIDFDACAEAATRSASSVALAQDRRRPTCSHCGLGGHTVDRCYRLHGYPPGLKPKPNMHSPDPNQAVFNEGQAQAQAQAQACNVSTQSRPTPGTISFNSSGSESRPVFSSASQISAHEQAPPGNNSFSSSGTYPTV